MMNFNEPPSTPDGSAQPGVQDLDASLAQEVARMPEIEAKYAVHLDAKLAPAVERNIGVYRDALADSLEGATSDVVRVAWAQHRVDEPQPEDVKFQDKFQLDYALARNVAYARELDARLVAEGKPRLGTEPSQPPRPLPAPASQPAAVTPPATPEIAPLRPEPLMLERLRELRQDPKIGALVDKDKLWLRTQPELVQVDARTKALEQAQADMRNAAAAGDKALERKLRIRVLALDEFAVEKPAPAAPAPKTVAVPPPRPLPVPSVEATDPPRPMSDVAQHFVVAPTEPPTIPAPVRSEITSEENRRVPVHRRSDLGLPPAPPRADEPTTRQAPAIEDESTQPMPPRSLPSTPLEPEAPPIHRRGDLLKDKPTDSLLDEFDDPTMPAPTSLEDAPTVVPPARKSLDDDPTAGGRRNRTPAQTPQPLTPEATQEVRPMDLVDDDLRPELDTQGRFDGYFNLKVQERSLRGEMRDDLGSFGRMRFRAEAGEPSAKEMLAEVQARAASFRVRPENALPDEVFRQYRTLVEDEQQPDRTGGFHLADRYALALLQQEADRRQAALAAAVANELLEDLRSSPAELEQYRAEAVLLMSTRQNNWDEYPYSDKPFLAAELVRSHEVDPDYAKVCALMLDAQRRVDTNYLLYEIERDQVAYRAAQDRASSMLQLPAVDTDDALMRELAEARVDYALACDPDDADRALARARETALIFEVLPTRRSLEVDTTPPPSRSAHV